MVTCPPKSSQPLCAVTRDALPGGPSWRDPGLTAATLEAGTRSASPPASEG